MCRGFDSLLRYVTFWQWLKGIFLNIYNETTIGDDFPDIRKILSTIKADTKRNELFPTRMEIYLLDKRDVGPEKYLHDEDMFGQFFTKPKRGTFHKAGYIE